jgi:hypothetical protein
VFAIPRSNDSEDGKKKATSSVVKGNKFATQMYVSPTSGSGLTKRAAIIHARETSKFLKIKRANARNKNMLGQMVVTMNVDDRVAAKAVEILDKISDDNDKGGIGWESRRTVKGRNVVFLDALLAVVEEDLNVRCRDDVYIAHAIKMSCMKHSKTCFHKFKFALKRVFVLGAEKEARVRDILGRAGIVRFVHKITRLLDYIQFNNLESAVMACARFVYTYYGESFRVQTSKRYIAMIEAETGFKLVESRVLPKSNFFIAKPGIVITDKNEAFDAIFNDEFDVVLERSLAFATAIGEEAVNRLLCLSRGSIDGKSAKFSLMSCFSGMEYEELNERCEELVKVAFTAPFFSVSDNVIHPAAFIDDIAIEVAKFFEEKHDGSKKAESTPEPTPAPADGSKMRVDIGNRRSDLGHDEQSLRFIMMNTVRRQSKCVHPSGAPEGGHVHWVRIKKVKEALRMIQETPEAERVASSIITKLPPPGTHGKWREGIIPKYVIYDLFIFLREYGFASPAEKKGEPLRFVTKLSTIVNFIDAL